MCSANIGRLLLSVAFTAHAAFSALAPIEDIHDLYRAIEAGPNRKVGFLSKGNFETVKEVLPSSVVPVYVEDTAHLACSDEVDVELVKDLGMLAK